MELGNLLFGHSRGAFRVDRASLACDLLNTLLSELGFDSYGRVDESVARRLDAADAWPDGLTPTDRGVDITDESGRLLLRTRAYWWGDDEDPQAGLANLECPPLGFALSWYKYRMRDAYSSQPLDTGIVERVTGLLVPMLRQLYPYVAHPVYSPLEWAGLDCRATSGTPDYDHGHVSVNPDTGLVDAEMISHDDMFHIHATLPDLDRARAWCARRAVRWVQPEERKGDA